MNSLDLDTLRLPISDDQPSGANLEYDAEMVELEQAAKTKPEQQYGSTIIPAEEPNWKSVHKLCKGLIGRTKDIRIAVHYGNASLALGNLAEFRDITALLLSYLNEFWSTAYPQLDADDDDDPTQRVNAIASLCDPTTTLKLLRCFPLVSRPGLGQYSLDDIEVVRGDRPPDTDKDPPTMSAIEGAFQDCNLDIIQATFQIVNDIKASIVGLENTLTEKVGSSRAVSFDALTHLIGEIANHLTGYLRKRQSESATPQGTTTPGGNSSASNASQSMLSSPEQSKNNGEIRGREDVIRAIDRICEYYDRYEPSSPLPLLLNRAKRLATKSFMEIIRDLTPDAIKQASSIGGIPTSDSDTED